MSSTYPQESTFYPVSKSGKSISATSTSARVALGTETGSLCVTNTGTELSYVCLGDSSVVADATDYPVLGGTQISIGRGPLTTHVAAICPGGTSVIKFNSGEGM